MPCLHDVGPGSEKLPVQLPHGLRVLHRGLGGPGPSLDVAALLKLEDKSPISNNWSGSETLQNTALEY